MVYIARKQAGMLPFWPSVLRELTGYDEKTHPQVGLLLPCVTQMHSPQKWLAQEFV